MPSPLRDTAACAAIGAGQSPGTKLISVCGPINRPGVFEVDMGYGLMEFQSHEAGGILNGRALKAVIPGGTQTRSSPLKRPSGDPGYGSMRQAGTLPGSGGVIVFDETIDMPHALLNIAKF